MTLDKAQHHFSDMLRELQKMKASPWPFMCAAAMLEYLAKMAIGNGRAAYIRFIRDFLRQEYRDFEFACGKKDLPEQMYHVLRCGLVHSFSLTPDKNQNKDGRCESIVLAHQGSHLDTFPSIGGHHLDAVWFVFGDFAEDIQRAIENVFAKAKSDSSLRSRIESQLARSPPVEELPLSLTATASGSRHS